jgi:hypothetical protein
MDNGNLVKNPFHAEMIGETTLKVNKIGELVFPSLIPLFIYCLKMQRNS